jgi:histidinol-phosphate aminotransferase
MSVSRRSFLGGAAAALGTLGSGIDLLAQGQGRPQAGQDAMRQRPSMDDYDAMAHLSSNENCWGPPDSVLKAMTQGFKYANRYGYPGGDVQAELAKLHGVKNENLMVTAGSGEVLDVVGTAFLQNGKKVLGVEPSYSSVYQHATTIKSSAIKLPLNQKDYRQNIAAIVKTANDRASEIGFVYICNPNNPTGLIVTKDEIKQLLDGIPQGMPVLIDEAYHHFVDDPKYATSIPYVIEGRPVIIARTFSKIAALAAMRLGYAVAPAELIQKMRPYAIGSVNVAVRYGGVAALKDTKSQAEIKARVIALRRKVTAELDAHGYETIPSEANFFMVSLNGREVQPVIEEFRVKKIAVGRPFPPMTKHMRVSVGTEDEMDRFLKAFKEIFPARSRTTAAG